MGKQTEYLKGKEILRGRILEYLIHRKEGILEMLKISFKRSGKINPIILEVMFTYTALISDIKKDRLD